LRPIDANQGGATGGAPGWLEFILQHEDPAMSTGEIAYLALVVVAFVGYMGLLAYGSIVAPERATPPAADATVARPDRSTRAA
jgi:hypothetical protein